MVPPDLVVEQSHDQAGRSSNEVFIKLLPLNMGVISMVLPAAKTVPITVTGSRVTRGRGDGATK